MQDHFEPRQIVLTFQVSQGIPLRDELVYLVRSNTRVILVFDLSGTDLKFSGTVACIQLMV